MSHDAGSHLCFLDELSVRVREPGDNGTPNASPLALNGALCAVPT